MLNNEFCFCVPMFGMASLPFARYLFIYLSLLLLFYEFFLSILFVFRRVKFWNHYYEMLMFNLCFCTVKLCSLLGHNSVFVFFKLNKEKVEVNTNQFS